MSMLRRVAAAIVVPVVATVAIAEDAGVKAPRLGTPLSADAIAKWDRTIFADGRGLPPGKGTAKDGRVIYEQKCASCHGEHGEGGTSEELVSGPTPPSPDNPSKAIGSYWPYATTIFDFVRRSMPPAAPGSLSADETYAVTAYLLAANAIIPEGAKMDAKTLAAVRMPNRDGFIWIDIKK
ncbi:c-type cytochrome [Hyphomicrobium facile]|uniref:Cytochrome c n=1 Tax=Hyphomicrobium facile TaxID=51670 RepID=A0A1I7NX13_9HYPH|nr:cytochrome c [Hyphomicrobium facile]SFV39158.1 cytochrome c [Hyphomicrobium facile]